MHSRHHWLVTTPKAINQLFEPQVENILEAQAPVGRSQPRQLSHPWRKAKYLAFRTKSYQQISRSIVIARFPAQTDH